MLKAAEEDVGAGRWVAIERNRTGLAEQILLFQKIFYAESWLLCMVIILFP